MGSILRRQGKAKLSVQAYQRALKLLGDLLGRGGRVPPDMSEVGAGGGTGGSHECKVLVEHAKRSRVLSRVMNAV